MAPPPRRSRSDYGRARRRAGQSSPALGAGETSVSEVCGRGQPTPRRARGWIVERASARERHVPIGETPAFRTRMIALTLIAIVAAGIAILFALLWTRTRSDIARLSDRLGRPDGEASASRDVDSFGARDEIASRV